MNEKMLNDKTVDENIDPFVPRFRGTFQASALNKEGPYRIVSLLSALNDSATSFEEFCKHIQVEHPIDGISPIDISLPYKKRMIEAYEKHRFNIICKFRQGGFSTFNVIWSLWKASTVPNTSIGIFAANEGMNRWLREKAKFFTSQFPAPISLFGNEIKFNNGSKITFRTPEPTCGHTFNYIFVDEAAFIRNMHDLWCALYPTLCKDGHVTICSSLPYKEKRDTNWFYQLYKEQKKQQTYHTWNIIPAYFEECTLYTPEKLAFLRKCMGPESFAQEVLCLYEE